MNASPAGLLLPVDRRGGFSEVVLGASPAAGAGFSYQDSQGYATLLLSLTFRFVTDANAANRTVRVEYDDGNGSKFYRTVDGTVQTANTTAFWGFAVGQPSTDFDTNNFLSAPLAPLFIYPGQKAQVNVTNVQVGDQLSQIVLLCEKFLPAGREA
jgi:hypothetical protein